MVSWAFLATLYFLPVWLIAFFANRHLSLRGSWRLAGAALMPGSFFLTTALLFYGLGVIDLVRVVVAAALHLIIGWVYLFASSLKLPPHPAEASLQKNPFASKPEGTKAPPEDAPNRIEPPSPST